MTLLLVGGYTGDKGQGQGITVLAQGEVVAVIPAQSPSWLARHPILPVLYSVAETDHGRVHAWSLADGIPSRELGHADTGGGEPAHLSIDAAGGYLITANYSGGNVAVHRLGPDGAIGERTDLIQHVAHGAHPRQEQAHPHMVRVAGDEVLVIDLGGDAIYRYRLTPDGTLVYQTTIAAPPGSGPRHLLRVGDRSYVTAELSGQVLSYDANWQLAGAVPASGKSGPNQPSELASSGRYLYVANRGPNTISVFDLASPIPRLVSEVRVGEWPRHVARIGGELYVANERSHSVTVLTIDPETGVPSVTKTIHVPSPTCVASLTRPEVPREPRQWYAVE